MLYKDLTSQPLELRDFSKIFKDLPFNPVQYKGKQKLNYRVTKQVLIDFFVCRGQDNEVDLDGGFEQELGFEAQATKPLSVFTQDQSTKTRVASTTLRSNFIFVDGKVNS